MTNAPHLVHGMGIEEVPADWPPLNMREIDELLASYPELKDESQDIIWHSPRPLSAAALVKTRAQQVFVKRHHVSVRTTQCLEEEHRFIAHLRAAGLPVVQVLSDSHGKTAVTLKDWTYEVHSIGIGKDIYRDATSWDPLTNLARARASGAMLARLHQASATYQAPQRSTHILVARDELIRADSPIKALHEQLKERPALADYLQRHHWEADFAKYLLPHHVGLAERLSPLPAHWSHNDWHVSNLLWQQIDGAEHISSVFDFGLASPTSTLFDLATAIERNAIAWLKLEQTSDIAHIDTALALIEGYHKTSPLNAAQQALLADLLPLVHLDFALSEVEYFHAITRSTENADLAYKLFLIGHAQWFCTPNGQALLQAIRTSN